MSAGGARRLGGDRLSAATDNEKLWVHWLLFGVGFAFALIVQTIFNTTVIH